MIIFVHCRDSLKLCLTHISTVYTLNCLVEALWISTSVCFVLFVLEGSICDEIFLDNSELILPVNASDAGQKLKENNSVTTSKN